MKSPFRSVPFWIGFFLFSVYLLSFSGKFHVMDELAVFTAANNLAQHGRADINQLIWTNHWTPNPPGIWGQDGHLYTKKAPGISLLTAPLIWLGHRLPNLNAVHVGLLMNAFVTALTAALLFIWLRDLNFSLFTAVLTALGYGLCTIAWIYARMFWESSALALCFLTAVWAVYRSTRLAYARQRLLWIAICGAAMAVGLTLRFETIPAVLFIALFLVWESAGWRLNQYDEQVWIAPGGRQATYQPLSLTRRLALLWAAIPWGRLAIYAMPIGLVGLGLLYFNYTRYGSLTETGYTQELLFREPWVGGFGLLFSPGRGLFIYSPSMLLLFFGLRPAWQRHSRPYFWLIVALSLFYWLFYGSWFAWGGTWGWGPRFLLPILPLLMLFVAEAIEWLELRSIEETKKRSNGDLKKHGGKEAKTRSSEVTAYQSRLTPHASRFTLLWLALALLALLSLFVNFLGIVVDFNEHFLRLGRNDNFVFNWATFPPVAHWQILQEGRTDVIWLRDDLTVDWPVLTPALLIFILGLAGLSWALRTENLKNKSKKPFLPAVTQIWSYTSRFRGESSRRTFQASGVKPATSLWLPYLLLFVLLPLTLLYETMAGTARIVLENEQAQADLATLKAMAQAAQPQDVVLVPMPPFGDVQELVTLMIGYLDQPLPVFAWIESPPRAIQPAEREAVWQAVATEASRVWLFERWLTPYSPLLETTARLNQNAFPLEAWWFDRSGKLTLYAMAGSDSPASPVTLNVPFQGGLTVLDFTLLNPTVAAGDSSLKLRLTWQVAPVETMTAQGLPPGQLIAFVQLLKPDGSANVAQQDWLLLDLQRIDQSPLLPGQTGQFGYGLALPGDLAPGVYPLIAGLYQAINGQRLPRADGSPDDFLYLTDVVVK